MFENYQHWQRELEANPVQFLERRAPDLLAAAREKLGAFICASGDDLTFVPNVTYGLNIVARSLKLDESDEILSTSHEYGAVDRTWRFSCEKTGALLVSQPITLPVVDTGHVIEQIWAGVSERTKVISLSHITSPSALILPVGGDLPTSQKSRYPHRCGRRARAWAVGPGYAGDRRRLLQR